MPIFNDRPQNNDSEHNANSTHFHFDQTQQNLREHHTDPAHKLNPKKQQTPSLTKSLNSSTTNRSNLSFSTGGSTNFYSMPSIKNNRLGNIDSEDLTSDHFPFDQTQYELHSHQTSTHK